VSENSAGDDRWCHQAAYVNINVFHIQETAVGVQVCCFLQEWVVISLFW